MPIDQLREVLPPPGRPVASGRPDLWEGVEAKLGARLPADYKDFISAYGVGDFYRFLGILSPFSKREPMVETNARHLPCLRDDVAPIFPTPGGLLICGGDENGNLLMWRTGGDPAAWPIVYASEEFIDFEIYEADITGFVAGWLSGEIRPRLIEPLTSSSDRCPYLFQAHSNRIRQLEAIGLTPLFSSTRIRALAAEVEDVRMGGPANAKELCNDD